MRKLALYSLWLLVALVLLSVSNYFLNQTVYDQGYSITSILLGNLGLVGIGLLIAGMVKSTQSKWLTSVVWLLFFITVFITLSEILVYKYSGVAFVEQAFLHFEIQSLLIGFSIYPLKYTAVVLAIAVISFALIILALPISVSKPSILAVVALVIITVIFNFGTSVGRLVTNYHAYTQQQEIELLTAQAVEPYAEFGIQPLGANKQMLEAEFAGKKKNLIIIYLESFSRGFINSEKYPNLTPEIDQLIAAHGEFENYQSTAKFTMQGLMSSLCGVIPRLAAGNNISSSQIPYKNLPCLPDILNQLGYHQEFMGGARKTFSNKEGFLKSKSFDQVWGWLDYPKPIGYKRNDWGLQDSDLLNFAFDRINELDSGQKPYHLSLLTLATHLDGNPDPSCPEYKPEEQHHKFINGIHCADYLLGQFVRQLEAQGLLENTAVLITSDHGVFDVELISELFGKGFNRNQLLGILIDDYGFDKSVPLALYDVAAIVLKSLNINFNSVFINGRSPEEVGEDRYILRENVLNNNDEFAAGCNETSAIVKPIDACENQRLVDKTWGYAASFNQELDIYKLEEGVVFNSTRSKNKRRSELYLAGKPQADNFLVNGYPISEQARKYRNHIYVLVYDVLNQTVDSYNAFRYIPMHTDYFYRLMFEETQEDKIYFVFTELSVDAEPDDRWNQVFKLLGSDLYNYPQQPYFAVFKRTDNNLTQVEWSLNAVQNLSLDLGDLSQLPFKPVAKH